MDNLTGKLLAVYLLATLLAGAPVDPPSARNMRPSTA